MQLSGDLVSQCILKKRRVRQYQEVLDDNRIGGIVSKCLTIGSIIDKPVLCGKRIVGTRMKNRFYDINSKETVRLAAEENAPGDEQAMIEQIAAIYRRIEALPEQGRRIFKMICIEHKSYVETARLLSLSLHTVKTHMSRSFKALRKMSMFFLTLF